MTYDFMLLDHTFLLIFDRIFLTPALVDFRIHTIIFIRIKLAIRITYHNQHHSIYPLATHSHRIELASFHGNHRDTLMVMGILVVFTLIIYSTISNLGISIFHLISGNLWFFSFQHLVFSKYSVF